MITTQEYDALTGKTVTSTNGEKIGTVQDVYASTDDKTPTFITVKTGMFGGKASFVPVAEATMNGEYLVVPYTKDQVKDAPNVEDDQELVAEEEDRLYTHYQLGSGIQTATTGSPDTGTATAGTQATDGFTGAGRDTSGPNTDEAMTRSEEQLNVDVQTRETGRARLVKRIVTEQQQVSVPVSHEEVRVVREPITDGNADAAYDGKELSEEEHEVVLTEQVPVVSTETRAVERVRLEAETVTDNETVTGEVRKEVIDTEGARDRNDS